MDIVNNNLSYEFALAKRSTYLKIDLDTILNNIRILKQKCSDHTEIMAVLKANGYGHGSVPLAKYLEAHGFRHFAVATGQEGEEMRKAGVRGNIHVLGNGSIEEITLCSEHSLVPTVGTLEYLSAWADHWRLNANSLSRDGAVGQVVIKIDTGMSRNGCQPEELPRLMEFCTNNNIPIHSLMSHFAQSWDDPVFTKQQYDLFLQAVKPYRSAGIRLHIANSGATVNGIGTELDYVRPGICIYGQPPDATEFSINKMKALGLKPAICWLAKRNLVKRLSPGRKVGYDQTYTCKQTELIATLPIGYADGYLRNMSGVGSLTTVDDIVCPVVGRVSMDGITVQIPEEAKECKEFYVMKDDYNMINSAVGIAKLTDTIPYEVCTNLDRRLPRIYQADGKIQTFT